MVVGRDWDSQKLYWGWRFGRDIEILNIFSSIKVFSISLYHFQRGFFQYLSPSSLLIKFLSIFLPPYPTPSWFLNSELISIVIPIAKSINALAKKWIVGFIFDVLDCLNAQSRYLHPFPIHLWTNTNCAFVRHQLWSQPMHQMWSQVLTLHLVYDWNKDGSCSQYLHPYHTLNKVSPTPSSTQNEGFS